VVYKNSSCDEPVIRHEVVALLVMHRPLSSLCVLPAPFVRN
jgi:hypothetical protein